MNKQQQWRKILGQHYCEACNSSIHNMVKIGMSIPIPLEYLKTPEGTEYFLCPNCMLRLITCSLSKSQVNNLLGNGHTRKEFYLHNDFYDDIGISLQPLI